MKEREEEKSETDGKRRERTTDLETSENREGGQWVMKCGSILVT